MLSTAHADQAAFELHEIIVFCARLLSPSFPMIEVIQWRIKLREAGLTPACSCLFAEAERKMDVKWLTMMATSFTARENGSGLCVKQTASRVGVFSETQVHLGQPKIVLLTESCRGPLSKAGPASAFQGAPNFGASQ